MSVKVCKAFDNALCIRLLDVGKRSASVHLETVESCYENCKVWLETTLAAFDVEELLGSEVSSESSLCDDVITESHCSLGRDD